MTTVAPQVWWVSGTPQGYSGNGNGAGMSPDTQWDVQRGCVLSQQRATHRMQKQAQKPWRLSAIPKKWMLFPRLCLPQRMPRKVGARTASSIWMNPKCIFLSLSQFVLLESHLSPSADPVPAQDTLISCSATHQHIPCDNEARGTKKK